MLCRLSTHNWSVEDTEPTLPPLYRSGIWNPSRLRSWLSLGVGLLGSARSNSLYLGSLLLSSSVKYLIFKVMCLFVCLCVSCLQRPEEGVGFALELVSSAVVRHPVWALGTDLQSMEEQHKLSSTALPLQPPQISLLKNGSFTLFQISVSRSACHFLFLTEEFTLFFLKLRFMLYF